MSAPVVVIMAAGEGTRMRSAIPKLLHPLCGRPMIGWPVSAALAAGAERVIVVDGPARRLQPALAELPEAVAAPSGAASLEAAPLGAAPLEVAIQEQPRGTADAVRAAADAFAGADTVIVLNGDVPLIRPQTISALADAHADSPAGATVATMVLEDPVGYGRVVRGEDGSVLRIVETKSAGDASVEELAIHEVNTGIYAFDGGLLAQALDDVRTHNAQGEYYLTDIVTILRERGVATAAHEIPDPVELLGVNDRVALATVRAAAQRRIHEQLMLGGVTIVDPASTVIDAGVEIGQDAVVAPFSSLLGATRVGAGAQVGPLSTLISTRVGASARVVHSYAEGADVGDRVSVGPFAYLRPGAVLREGSKAGTFVEIKNSTVGAGAKVPHLSYVGDTDIGERANLGAGTITANYDGVNKHRTSIGAGAFVAVDTMFVAPVSLGDGAYTGAGSVITDDVPPGGLGIARSRQRTIEGYGERRRARRQAADASPEQAGTAAPSAPEGADPPAGDGAAQPPEGADPPAGDGAAKPRDGADPPAGDGAAPPEDAADPPGG